MKRESKYSEAERAAWKEKMRKVARLVKDMGTEERERLAVKCGTLTAEGRTLSPYNTCFLWIQAQKALAQVGGFNQWQRVGRKVRAGEKACGYIYVPLGVRSDSEGGPETESDERPRFRLVPVFDVTQTEESEAVAA